MTALVSIDTCLGPRSQTAYAVLLTSLTGLVIILGLKLRRARCTSTNLPLIEASEKSSHLTWDNLPNAAICTQKMTGDWVPPNHNNGSKWLAEIADEAAKIPGPLNNVLQEFKEVIENDAVLFMLFSLMFDEVPMGGKYKQDLTDNRQLRHYDHMLQVFNILMTRGPPWMYNTAGQKGLVGFPFGAVLDWPMATPAGTVAFVHAKVNEQFKNILNAWAEYLNSPASLSALNTEDGWLSKQALHALSVVASDGSSILPHFEEIYICDPSKPYYGFRSWDDFFTRRFREHHRPVSSPENASVITNACESAPLRISHNLQHRDKFWLKSQPYSLYNMLAGDQLTSKFVGGTIYQAFLSALSYHRWHSPVSGTVVKVLHQPGTYYAENYWAGFGKSAKYGQAMTDAARGPDPTGPNESQAYIAEVATRATIYIEADNPAIGLICVVFIGIAEVSSCEFTVKEGQHVEKGDEIGMFHYGGSTYCLLFQAGVDVKFVKKTNPDYTKGKDVNIPVRSELARIH